MLHVRPRRCERRDYTSALLIGQGRRRRHHLRNMLLQPNRGEVTTSGEKVWIIQRSRSRESGNSSMENRR
jgi:hypothetical protein